MIVVWLVSGIVAFFLFYFVEDREFRALGRTFHIIFFFICFVGGIAAFLGAIGLLLEHILIRNKDG